MRSPEAQDAEVRSLMDTSHLLFYELNRGWANAFLTVLLVAKSSDLAGRATPVMFPLERNWNRRQSQEHKRLTR
jgi:hypothetical protein